MRDTPKPSDDATLHAAWTAEEASAMDRWLIDERGFTLAALMEQAGARVAEEAAAVVTERGLARIVFLVGPGHNGGDALVAERLLHARRERTTIVWRPLQGDAPPPLDARTLLVDGLFGVGLSRIVVGAARGAIEHVNASPACVLAIDIPSGLHATTGAVMGAAVRALRTVTFVGAKRGFFLGEGPAHVGAWRAVEIGFPAAEAEAWRDARRVRGPR
jgi:NAD(P)H-hydrate epimerase